jgi:hypothetical protein
VRKSVEAVNAYAEVAYAPGEGVGRCRPRNRGVEGGVEAGDLGHPGPGGPSAVHRPQRGRLVQRSELGELVELGAHRVVDQHRCGAAAAVHHAVSDRVGRAVGCGGVRSS